jgi:nitrite reductase/ring-hydroxylating ferredoxin subunit
VTSYSNIRFFVITLLLALTSASCNKNNDVIPDVYIDFTLDLNDPEFIDLNSLGGTAVVDASTNNWGSKASGYDGNGIIIYSGLDEFYAYDRTCPHDYSVNGLSIQINVDFIKANCPRCSTIYELAAYGTPAAGVGRYPLKNYRTSFDGRFIRVWNN